MKITEKMLLDGYVGLTWCLSQASEVNGIEIYWKYRIIEDGEPSTACAFDEREIITLEHTRKGEINIDIDNNGHAAVAKIKTDYEKAFGTEI